MKYSTERILREREKRIGTLGRRTVVKEGGEKHRSIETQRSKDGNIRASFMFRNSEHIKYGWENQTGSNGHTHTHTQYLSPFRGWTQ